MHKDIKNITVSWGNMVSPQRSASPVQKKESFSYSNMPEHDILSYRDQPTEMRMQDAVWTPITSRDNINIMLQKLEHRFGEDLYVQNIMEEAGDEGEDVFDIRISLKKNIVNLNIYVDQSLSFEENEVYLVCKNNIQIGIVNMLPLMLNSCIYV